VGGHPVVTSTKSMTGHMLGAAGSLEAIATMLSVKEGVVPGTRNISTIDPEIKVDVATENREVTLTAALNDSFGFGGHNVALIFTAA
jgi:3-oxoacyl-[acyl-carrier-protein] synthase II